MPVGHDRLTGYFSFFFSSRRRHTRYWRDWSSDVCSSDLYASAKYPGRAPAGHMLLRAFLAPSDGEPGALAHAELAPLLRITGAPLWTRAFHWPHGLPRYEAHHAARVARVRERLARLAPIAIAGAGCGGAGMSAGVRSGRAAARPILRRMGGRAD